MPILFHDDFLKDESRQAEVKKWRDTIKGQNKKGILPFSKGIFWRDSVLDQLPSISIPTATIVGEFDNVTPPEVIQRVVDAIPNAKLYTIPGSGHSAPIEKPAEVTEAMKAFYQTEGIL
jgi:pimeloyl-ACP methyl ester carboxylesterase